MKQKIWVWACLAIVVACGLVGVVPASRASAQSTQDFTISSFTADYYLSRTKADVSQMKANEVIVADFPQYDQNHGILRAIPESYQGHTVSLKVDSVTGAAGQKLHYTTYEQNNNLVLQIGDASTYVHGAQTYNVDYTMQNVTGNFASDDELYWNVNGTQWDQTMNAVTARVHLTSDLAVQFSGQLKCFTGSYGANASDCTTTVSSDKTLITAQTSRPLVAGETLTFVAGFPSKTFAKYRVSPAHIAFIMLLIAVPILITAGFIVSRWCRYGRDPKGQGTIVPEYLPPKEASVLMSGVVLKEHVATSHISAQVIDLAVRHYVRIYQTLQERTLRPDKLHYEIELIKSLDDLRPEEREVADALFGAGAAISTRVSVDELSHKLAVKAQSLSKTLPAVAAKQGYFVKNPVTVVWAYAGVGVFLCIASVSLLDHSAWLAIGLFGSGLLCMAVARLMSARSEQGVALRDYLFGLKYYMQVAEAERIRMLQSPRGELTEKVQIDPNDPAQLVKLYERLLPFAMLFGIENDWASQFAAMYKTPPDWFVGNWAAFNAGYFVGSLNGFSTVSGAAFTVPRGSGTSGFGGGFAGGGGGGGGGGGW